MADKSFTTQDLSKSEPPKYTNVHAQHQSFRLPTASTKTTDRKLRGREIARAKPDTLTWAECDSKVLISLGCLAVLLRSKANRQSLDMQLLVCSLEGVLKHTLENDVRQEREKARETEHEKHKSAKKEKEKEKSRFATQTHASSKTATEKNCKDPGQPLKQIANFTIVYIRIYGTMNHMLRDRCKVLAARMQICGFVDIALLLLARRSLFWGLGEELLVFMSNMTEIHGTKLLGSVQSRALFNEPYCHELTSDEHVESIAQGCENKSKEAIPIMIKALCIFGVTSSKDAQEEGEKVKSISLRATGEGLHVLTLLSAQNASCIVENGGIEFALRAMHCHASLAPLQTVGASLCQRLLYQNETARQISVRAHLHDISLKNIQLHAAHADVVEASLYCLRRMTFESLHLRNTLVELNPFACIAEVLHTHREKGHVMVAAFAFLCNITRSLRCATMLVDSIFVNIVVTAMLHHQGHAEVVKYGAWTLFNMLAHEAALSRGKIEEMLTASFPAILVHVMNQHLSSAPVQAALCALVAVVGRVPSFLEPLQHLGACEATLAAMQTHTRDTSVHKYGVLALQLLKPFDSPDKVAEYRESSSDIDDT